MLRICEDRELYVVGSQSILGAHPQAPPELCRSMEVDIAPKNHPELEALIEGSIGELSPFHQTFGFYVDGVDLSGMEFVAAMIARKLINSGDILSALEHTRSLTDSRRGEVGAWVKRCL